MANKEKALQQIDNIAQQAELEPQVIYDYLLGKVNKPLNEKSALLPKVLSYLGCVFLLGGVISFISLFWFDIGTFGRIGLSLGLGFSIYLLACYIECSESPPAISTPLHILAFLIQIVGLFVFLASYYPSSATWEHPSLFVFGILGLQQGLTLVAFKRAVFVFNALLCLTICAFAIVALSGIAEKHAFILVGLLLLALSYLVDKSSFKIISGFWYFFGSAFFLGGLFSQLEGQSLDFLFLLPSCFLVYLSTLVKSRTLLFVSILATFLFLGYFTHEHFTDSIGWPLSLMLLGALLIGLGSLGLKISKKF